MTREEARQHDGYKEAYAKIESYRKGFEFTINFSVIPKAKANGLRLILKDAVNNGLLESIAFGLDINGNIKEETFKRI